MKKIKRVMAGILVGGILCVSLAGCSKPSDSIVREQSTGGTETEPQISSANNDGNRLPLQITGENVPASDEEYVYDYQVSMDPIPKEIADLGGPCQGTIHAFPSRIEIGLTQKMMEEDPELKAEVEKRIPEVEQALKDEFGGEFRVDGVSTLYNYGWRFFCTEVETGYTFDISYYNYEYAYKKQMISIKSNNQLHTENYCSQDELEEMQRIVDNMLKNSFGECLYQVAYSGRGQREDLYIRIMQFTDMEVEKAEEQIKILKLAQEIKEYNEEFWYAAIDIRYYPTRYQEVMEQKCKSHFENDIVLRYVDSLMEQEEIKERYFDDDLFDDESTDKDNLNLLLEQYEQGTYDRTKIWSTWY